jgi:hypothetical protein
LFIEYRGGANALHHLASVAARSKGCAVSMIYPQ